MTDPTMTTTPADGFLEFARGIGADTREFVLEKVAAAVAPVVQRVDALEMRPKLTQVGPLVEGQIATGVEDRAVGDAITAAIKICRTAGLSLAQIDATCDLTLAFLGPTFNTYRARIQQLETRPTLTHVGAFKSGESYAAGTLVQHQGSCWLAKQTTSATPGTALDESRAWTLVAKRGSDGADSRELRNQIAALTQRIEHLEQERR